MSKSDIIKFLILRSIGNFLLLFAIFGVAATFGPALYYEAQFRIANFRGVQYAIDPSPVSQNQQLTPIRQMQQQEPGFGRVLTGPKEQILMPKDTQFGILIPKIGANAVVFPNVDPTKEKEFLPVLYQGVAHAKGTVFPGQKGNIYLFAHSADNFWDAGRYNAIFYLIKDLAVGDNITVFFENIRHNYTVAETKVIDASDVSYLVESQHGGEERLILQTCWPPGTTWKRLVVIAKPG